MKRVLGIVFLGLGIALATFAAGLRFYVTPLATNIPYDLDESTSIAEATNGQYINTSTGEVESGTLRSSTFVVPQPVVTKEKLTGDLAETAVVWDVYSQTVDVATGTVITADTQELALDRKTGAAADWDGAWVDSGEGKEPASFEGHSYKLPFNAEQTSYPFWDDTLGRVNDIDFVAVETVSGLEAYTYEQTIPAEQIPYDPESVELLRLFFGGGSGDVYYEVTRAIYVEPVTGQFLNVKQSVNVEFRGGNGTTKTLLKGDFEYTDETKASSAASISENRRLLLLVSTTLPLGGGAGGVVLLILGIVLIAVGGSRKPPAEAADASPAPSPAPVPATAAAAASATAPAPADSAPADAPTPAPAAESGASDSGS